MSNGFLYTEQMPQFRPLSSWRVCNQPKIAETQLPRHSIHACTGPSRIIDNSGPHLVDDQRAVYRPATRSAQLLYIGAHCPTWLMMSVLSPCTLSRLHPSSSAAARPAISPAYSACSVWEQDRAQLAGKWEQVHDRKEASACRAGQTSPSSGSKCTPGSSPVHYRTLDG